MIDITLLRTDPDLVRHVCQAKGSDVDVDKLISLDTELRRTQNHMETLALTRRSSARAPTRGRSRADGRAAGRHGASACPSGGARPRAWAFPAHCSAFPTAALPTTRRTPVNPPAPLPDVPLPDPAGQSTSVSGADCDALIPPPPIHRSTHHDEHG